MEVRMMDKTERVARAILEAHNAKYEGTDECIWDTDPEHWLMYARAAIAAMSEPEEAPPPDPSDADLVARLLLEYAGPRTGQDKFINQDGPEAAAAIERLTRERDDARSAIEVWHADWKLCDKRLAEIGKRLAAAEAERDRLATEIATIRRNFANAGAAKEAEIERLRAELAELRTNLEASPR
jgi:hypothetical protein